MLRLLLAGVLLRSLGNTREWMTIGEVLAFVEKHGVVLVSAKGPVPRLTETIVTEAIKGSWWAHPQSHHIFAILQAVTESENILVCRLINGKLTLVHRHLWPALVRLARRFPSNQLAKVRQKHTSSGHHINEEVPFPKWVPADVKKCAEGMGEAAALAALGTWARVPDRAPRGTRRKRRAR